MGLPPWASSSSQLFVLVTGSNSGLGHCICQRLIAEFLSSPSRDPRSHLVLIVTTRSVKKTRDTIARLDKHARSVASLTETAQSDGWRQTMNRIHILGTEVDLCDIRGVYETATVIRERGMGNGNGFSAIMVPRIDVMIMNAGISGYYGFHYPRATRDILTSIKQSVTWPQFLKAHIGLRAQPQRLLEVSNGHTVDSGETTAALLKGDINEDEPLLGQIFAANVFGHYLLAHALMPLLTSSIDRPVGDRARIVWLSSLDALDEEFNVEDIQGMMVKDAYKSSKRLTDLLALTSHLPGVQRASSGFFALEEIVSPDEEENTPRKSKRLAANGSKNGHAINSSNGTKAIPVDQRPEMYVAHPGICVTDIIATALWQTICWTLALYIARWLGSVWHTITPAKGACAPVWTALTEQRILDSLEGPDGTKKGKWGTSTDFWGEERVRRTEVEGWGWDGVVKPEFVGDERKGRKRGALATTKESREEFEVEGAKAWTEMEALRKEWENRLGLGAEAKK